MWERLNQLIKPNGAIVLFGNQPFTSTLIMSNIKCFKYSQVWKKSKSGSAITAKYRPLAKHEDILIFSKKNERVNYNPQMKLGKPYSRKFTKHQTNNMKFGITGAEHNNNGTRHPDTILDYPQQWRRQDQVHPTQKPVALMEYLIKTYTNEGELILDFTMGSGTTCVAAYNTGRKCIGIEMDDKYFEVAKQRVSDAINTKASQLF